MVAELAATDVMCHQQTRTPQKGSLGIGACSESSDALVSSDAAQTSHVTWLPANQISHEILANEIMQGKSC